MPRDGLFPYHLSDSPGLPDELAMHRLLARLGRMKVLCVGDVMLDRTVLCEVGRVSPEAPVPVAAQGGTADCPGGAANVAANLAGLGARVWLVAPLAGDEEGDRLRSLLAEAGVVVLGGASQSPTTVKTRFIARGQQLLRLDRDGIVASADPVHRLLAGFLQRAPARLDALVVSDYGKGAVSEALVGQCLALGQAVGAPVLVDPKGGDWRRYGPVDLIKPNADELADFTGLPCGSDDEVALALAEAMALCDAKALVVTRAGKGASVMRRGHEAFHVPAFPIEVSDVCGAGDTNLATLALGLAAGLDWRDVVALAQLASSRVVSRQGTVAITAAGLALAAATAQPPRLGGKILGRAEAALLARSWREAGLRVGFTNGCFDIIHAGHVKTIEGARALCDRLIVGLNADSSVRRLKGPSRPVNPAEDRALVLMAMAAVDAVVIFGEDSPEALIAELLPDYLVKGADYNADTIAGASIVRERGGRVVTLPLLPDRSTTAIVGRRAEA